MEREALLCGRASLDGDAADEGEAEPGPDIWQKNGAGVEGVEGVDVVAWKRVAVLLGDGSVAEHASIDELGFDRGPVTCRRRPITPFLKMSRNSSDNQHLMSST
jgi:hypothetical protein